MYQKIIVTVFVAAFVAPTALLAADGLPVKTIEQIYAEQAQLAGKHIHVSGKVVKVNNNIMGKNFLHIQDGTGAEGTNDVAVTSQQSAEIGDQIAVDALVTVGKDFGYGYTYPVLLEEAKLSPAK
jgi:hypothetical protein